MVELVKHKKCNSLIVEMVKILISEKLVIQK
jgi:hypothetical protein